MADNAARIAEIRAFLQTGASSTSVDGLHVSFDRETLENELQRLMEEDAIMQTKRPVASSIVPNWD